MDRQKFISSLKEKYLSYKRASECRPDLSELDDDVAASADNKIKVAKYFATQIPLIIGKIFLAESDDEAKKIYNCFLHEECSFSRGYGGFD